MPTSENNDTGSLFTGSVRLEVGDRIFIRGETTTRTVSNLIADGRGGRVALKGSGIVPTGTVVWDRIPRQGEDWTEAECEATVDAYLQLDAAQRKGEPVNKAELYRQLSNGALAARTVKAIERKFMNVSAVLNGLGIDFARGLVPAENSQRMLDEVVARHLSRNDLAAPTDDERKLSARAAALRAREPTHVPPTGIERPQRIERQATVYCRDPEVVAYVLSRAAGRCECCGEAAPFSRENGEPYLEVHHLTRLADDGPDVVSNAVAVCPNCHRMLHHGADRGARTEQLRERLA